MRAEFKPPIFVTQPLNYRTQDLFKLVQFRSQIQCDSLGAPQAMAAAGYQATKTKKGLSGSPFHASGPDAPGPFNQKAPNVQTARTMTHSGTTCLWGLLLQVIANQNQCWTADRHLACHRNLAQNFHPRQVASIIAGV